MKVVTRNPTTAGLVRNEETASPVSAHAQRAVEAEANHSKLREQVASEYGFRLARQYSEQDAAQMLGMGINTLRRKRRKRLVPFVDRGDGSIAYLGVQVADIIILGVKAIECLNTPSGNTFAVSGGSKKEDLHTMASDMLRRSAAMSAVALARQTLKRPSKS